MKKDKDQNPQPAVPDAPKPESDQFHRTMKALLSVPAFSGQDKRPRRTKKD